ncbi:MAG: TlpA family protein disulfide reductase [Gammaproteobacteria bacterium]|nr:TlpA family protein disulfide reductase [Gammaproteobacteria bacterium]MDH3534800.1 TlpA family protein disulfide reductase [Gammaproteobacteria bacterium]
MKDLSTRTCLSLALVFFLSISGMGLASAASVKGPAPNFTLKSLSGENLKLSEMTGNVVLINFWASWCGPCREEMPLLNALHKKYEPLGFTVIGVNVEEDVNNARGFLKSFPVNFPVLLDNTNKVSKQYNVIAMPTTVVVDRDGNMRYLHKGYKPGDEDKYTKMVKKLVRE